MDNYKKYRKYKKKYITAKRQLYEPMSYQINIFHEYFRRIYDKIALEIGCGTGEKSIALSKLFRDYIASNQEKNQQTK